MKLNYKDTDILAKVFILIPVFLFILMVIFLWLDKHFGNSLFFNPRSLAGYCIIVHIFPGIILSIIGLIRTKDLYMGKYRALAYIQIILDIVAIAFYQYVISHA